MRLRSVKVFRSLSYLHPRVDIAVTRPAPDKRIVTVSTTAGSLVTLEPLRFLGVSPDEEAVLLARFRGPLERAELAAGEKDAERRIKATLRSLGYPLTTLASTEPGEGGLVVTVAPGPRSVVSSVRVEGVTEEDRARLLSQLPFRAGDGGDPTSSCAGRRSSRRTSRPGAMPT